MSELHVKIGKLLKLERERRGVRRVDLLSRLKMSDAHLGHIESGDIDALPSEIYFNLFAKSYAEALDLDYTATVEAIREDIGQPLEPEGGSQPAKGRGTEPKDSDAPDAADAAGRRFLRTFAFIFAAVVVIFVLFAAVNYFFLDGEETGTVPDTMPATETGEETPVLATDDSAYRNYDWSQAQFHPPVDLVLQMVARDESWAIVIADGDTVIARRLIPQKVYRVRARFRFQVSIAWPSRVAVELNGTPVNLRGTDSGRISRVKITQANIDSILNPPLPIEVDSGLAITGNSARAATAEAGQTILTDSNTGSDTTRADEEGGDER